MKSLYFKKKIAVIILMTFKE